MRRYDRERPYALENRDSLARKAQPPKDLLAWFVTEFRAEIPARLHGRGVWAAAEPRGDEEVPLGEQGGSLLGSPKTSDGFRAYLEGHPTETELARWTDDGTTTGTKAYRMPIRAALHRLSGRGRDTDEYPFMGRVLYRTAMRDGDWDSACASFGIPEPVRRVYVYEALRRLWSKYDPEPPARLLPEKVA